MYFNFHMCHTGSSVSGEPIYRSWQEHVEMQSESNLLKVCGVRGASP